MPSLRFLLPVCVCVILSGCAAMQEHWRQTYCSREGGYRLGIEHASKGFSMQPQMVSHCPESVRSQMGEAYREGYASVTQSAPAAPPPAASASVSPPAPEAPPAAAPAPQSSSAAAPSGDIRCCLNGAYYSCPDVAAADRCGGAFSRCLMGCMNSTDFKCEDRCFQSTPPDPSACQRDSSRDSACR